MDSIERTLSRSVVKKRARGFVSWLLSCFMVLQLMPVQVSAFTATLAGEEGTIHPDDTINYADTTYYIAVKYEYLGGDPPETKTSYINGSRGSAYTVLYMTTANFPDAVHTDDFQYWNYKVETICASEGSENVSVTLTAVYDLKYNITYNLNDSAAAPASINDQGYPTTYRPGTGATLPTDVTRPGYKFCGWYPDPACSDPQVTEIASTESGDKAFYAKWEAKTDRGMTVSLDDWTYGDAAASADITNAYTQNYTVSYAGRNSTTYGPSPDVPTNAGTYTITVSAAEDDNYLASSASDDFEIFRAPLAVKANDNTITYGDAAADNGFVYGKGTRTTQGVTYTYNGFTPAASDISGTVTYQFLDTSDNSYSISVPAQMWRIIPSGLTSSNYDIEFVEGDLTVGPKTISIVWENKSSYTYDGSEHCPTASLDQSELVSTTDYNLLSDDLTVTVSGTNATGGKAIDAGDYTADANIPFSGNAASLADSYIISGTTKNFTISPKAVTVTWTGDSFDYDGNAKKPTAAVSGIIAGDGCNTQINVSAKSGSSLTGGNAVNAGSYTATLDISFTTASDADNYTINNSDLQHDFTINGLGINPGVNIGNWTYGETAKAPALTNGSNPGNGTVKYYYKKKTDADTAYSDTVPTAAGNYTVKAVIGATTNYSSGEATADFTIAQKEVTLTWGSGELTYNGIEQCPTLTLGGLVGNDVCTATVTGKKKNAGTGYTAAVTALSNTNYKLPAAGTTKTYSIAPITVGLTWGSTSFVYNKMPQCPIVTLTGVLSADTCTATVTGARTNAGTGYTAEVSALSNSNYKTPEMASTTFDIDKAPQDPPVVNAVNETVAGKADGMIKNITSTMEYRTEGVTAYTTAGTGTAISGLAPGRYYVRYAETANYYASADAPVNIGTGRQVTITFNTLGGTTIAPITQNYGTAVTAPADPVKDLAKFTGWDKAIPAVMPDSDITITAKWMPLTAVPAKAPKCEEDGNKFHYRATDSTVYYDNHGLQQTTVPEVTIPATGHTEAIDAAKEPTCTETGLTEGKHCSVCSKVLIPQKIIPAKGHVPGEPVKENVKDPDCIHEGSYEEAVYCTVCSTELSREYKTTDALGHLWGEWIITREPTPQKDGEMKQTCSRCGAVNTKKIPWQGNDPTKPIPKTTPQSEPVKPAPSSTGEFIPDNTVTRTAADTPAPSLVAPIRAEDNDEDTPTDRRHIHAKYDGKNTIKLWWDGVDEADSYTVYLITGRTAKKLKVTDRTSYTFTDAKDGSTYTFKVKYSKTGVSDADSYRITIFADNSRPVVTAVLVDGKVKLSWSEVPDAEEYAVYRVKEDGSLRKIGTTKKTAASADPKPDDTGYAVKAHVGDKWTKVTKNDIASIG